MATNGRAPTLNEAKARFKSSLSKARAATKQNSSSGPKAVREWRVTLLRYRGEFLGHVKAPSRESAETEAARLFSLSEFHRKRLLLQERL